MENYQKKKAPVHPLQLTTERMNCDTCPAKYADTEDKNICKCAGCGIGTNDFIRGALIELYVKHPDYPVVLIENVCCPSVEQMPAYQDAASRATVGAGFVPFETEELKEYYLEKINKKTIRTYHVFDLSDYYNLNSKGCCIERRREDPEFKKACFQCDLRTTSDILNGRADRLDRYKKVTYPRIETPVYAYYCERSGCHLIELAFPILIDHVCVAVLIIGQIDPKSEDNLETVMEKNVAEMKEITQDADAFSKRMQERAHLRKSDYYYRQLSKQYEHLAEHLRESKGIGYAIEMLYQDIAEAFDCRELAVLYTNKNEDAGFSCIRFPNERAKEISFTMKKLREAVYADDEEQLRGLFQTGKDDTVSFYRQHSHSLGKFYTVDCFILTYVHWERSETKGVENFFDALNARLFSLLMTEIAQDKQREQDTLIQTFSHDLNQKLEIVGGHTTSLDTKKDSWGLPPESQAFDDIRNYLKDIKSLEMQLRHFTWEVRENNSGFPVTKDVRVFKPYGQFIFNLEEYYNSHYSVRKLVVPSVSGVSLNPSRYPSMKADPVLIERCISNLLNNAFKYSYRYTNIYLDCFKKGKDYCIEVTNFTSPIKDDVKDHMFGFGVSQSLIRNYRRQKGKGIGLANVQKICELHGGKVECFADEQISEYNVPVLFRLIHELYDAKRLGKLKERLASLKIEENDYDGMIKEYRRLCNLSVTEESNYVAAKYRIRNQIKEICNYSKEFTEKLTAPYLRMGLRTPTARVVFRITIPQE